MAGGNFTVSVEFTSIPSPNQKFMYDGLILTSFLSSSVKVSMDMQKQNQPRLGPFSVAAEIPLLFVLKKQFCASVFFTETNQGCTLFLLFCYHVSFNTYLKVMVMPPYLPI